MKQGVHTARRLVHYHQRHLDIKRVEHLHCLVVLVVDAVATSGQDDAERLVVACVASRYRYRHWLQWDIQRVQHQRALQLRAMHVCVCHALRQGLVSHRHAMCQCVVQLLGGQ